MVARQWCSQDWGTCVEKFPQRTGKYCTHQHKKAQIAQPHCNLDIAEYFLQTNLGTTSTDFPQIKQAFYLVPRGLLKRDAEVSNIKAEQFQCDQNMFKIFRALISEKV